MGISYSSRVVVGFKVDIVPKNESVTKYNEDTGKPYTVENQVGTNVVSGDVVLCDSGSDGGYHYQGEQVHDLELFGDGYDTVNQYVLGVMLARTFDGAGVEEIQVETVPDNVQAVADKYGLQPGVFLVMSCG